MSYHLAGFRAEGARCLTTNVKEDDCSGGAETSYWQIEINREKPYGALRIKGRPWTADERSIGMLLFTISRLSGLQPNQSGHCGWFCKAKPRWSRQLFIALRCTIEINKAEFMYHSLLDAIWISIPEFHLSDNCRLLAISEFPRVPFGLLCSRVIISILWSVSPKCTLAVYCPLILSKGTTTKLRLSAKAWRT
jgi:hypothetical protein